MRILVFGDSIAYGSWDSQGGWADRLKRTFHQQYTESAGANKVQLFNLGIGGDTSTNILARVKQETDARYSVNWEDVFIFGFGTNDARLNEGVTQTELSMFLENTRQIVATAQKYSKRILFVGIPPVKDGALDFKKTVFNDLHLKEYGMAQRDVIVTMGLPFVDLRDAFEERRSELFAVDGLHPNDAGHELIAKLVEPELVKLLTQQWRSGV